MTDAFLSDVEAALAREDFHNLFLTVKKLGTRVDITLIRTDPDTGAKSEHIYTDVLLTLAARQADTNAEGGGVRTTTTQAQLSREIPFVINAGDRFNIL